MTRREQLLLGLVCVTLYVLIGLTASVNASAQNAAQALAPRGFLPLVMGKWASGPPPVSLFGVSDSSALSLAGSAQARRLAIVAGVSGNRTSVSWENIEPVKTTPDKFDWKIADANLLPLIYEGFEPQVLILGNPTWAANTPCGPLYDPNDLAPLIEALGTRYPQVKYWALYNEVDLTTYSKSGIHNGGCFGEADIDHNDKPDYADYAELMRVARHALHAANPDAKLVFGLLSYDNFDPADSPPNYPGGCCFAYSFLDKLLGYMQAHPLGAGEKYADVFGFNNYMLYDKAFWEKYYAGDGISAKVTAINRVQDKYGFSFPLLTSELSSGTTGPDRPASYQGQARDLSRLYIQSVTSGLLQSIWWVFADFPARCTSASPGVTHPNLERILNNELGRPQGAVSDCGEWTFGIVDEHLQPKLSYFAFKTVSEELGSWSPIKNKVKNGLYSYFFQKDGQEKRAYYGKDGALRTIRIKADKVRVVDMYGKETYPKPEKNGRFKVTIVVDPVFVELNPSPR